MNTQRSALQPPPRHPIDTRLPALLRSGQVLRGIFNSIPKPALVEMCADAGFDFIVFDNEHGSADLQTTEHTLRATVAAGKCAAKCAGVLALDAAEQQRYAGWGARYFAQVITSLIARALRDAAGVGGSGGKSALSH